MNVITPKRKARLLDEFLEWEDETVVVRVPYARVTGVEHASAAMTVAIDGRPPLTMAFPDGQARLVAQVADRLAERAGTGDPGHYYERVKSVPRYAGLTFDAWFGIALFLALGAHVVASVVRGEPLLIALALLGLPFWFIVRAMARWDLDGRAVYRFDRTQPGFTPGPPAPWAFIAFYAIEAVVAAAGLIMLPVVAFYLD